MTVINDNYQERNITIFDSELYLQLRTRWA